MIFALFGPPGSGKGTQAERVLENFPLGHISTGDLLRAERRAGTPLGIKAGEIMSRGQFVPDELVAELVRKEVERILGNNKGILFDGYPRNLAQLRWLDRMLAGLDRMLEFGITLDIDDERLIKRLTSRRVCEKCRRVYNLIFNPPRENSICDGCGGKLYQRTDDRQEAIENRLTDYHRQTQPVLDDLEERGKLERVKADRPIEIIHGEILSLLRGRTADSDKQ